MTIGEKIKTKRMELNLTQEALAKELNVSRPAVSSWEVGRNYPDLEMIVRISDVLSISLDDLLREDQEMVKTMDRKVKNNKKYKRVIAALVVLILIPLAFEGYFQVVNHRYLENVSSWDKGEQGPYSEGSYELIEDGVTYSTFVFQKGTILLPIMERTPWLVADDKEAKLVVDVKGKDDVSTLIIKDRDDSVDFKADVQINEKGEMIGSKKEMSPAIKEKTEAYLKQHQTEYQALYKKAMAKWLELTE